MPEDDEDGQKAREELLGRSISLEQGYVHEVYSNIAKDLSFAPDIFRTTVEEFLKDLEPGSLVADVGCGDGRHLSLQNSTTFNIGVDRCPRQTDLAHDVFKQEVLVADNLKLPYRDDTFDAVLSVSVVHHCVTKERRVRVLRELARILKVGGKLLVVVQAEIDGLQCESQDVLIPWFEKTKPHKDISQQNTPINEETIENYITEENNDDDDDDDISIVSSGDEDAHLPSDYKPSDWTMAVLRRQRFSGDHNKETSNPTNQTVSVDSCYAFVKSALRRFSSHQVQRSESLDLENPEAYRKVVSNDKISDTFIPEDSAETKKEHDFKGNIIELRNLDDDLEKVFGQPSEFLYSESQCPLSPSTSLADPLSPVSKSTETRKKLVRSVSDFFRKIPSMLSIRPNSSSSASDLANLARSTPQNDSTSKPSIVRSQTTATCSLKFESYPRLESVEENNFNESDEEEELNEERQSNNYLDATESDIANGNILSSTKESFNTRVVTFEKCESFKTSVDQSVFEPEYEYQNSSSLVDEDEEQFEDRIVIPILISDSSEEYPMPKISKRALEDSIEKLEDQMDSIRLEDFEGSPKKRRKFCNSDLKMVSSKTLGPFYDIDEGFDDDTLISSYYSMPELSRLTEYYDKYVAPKRSSIADYHYEHRDRLLQSKLNFKGQIMNGSCVSSLVNRYLHPDYLTELGTNLDELRSLDTNIQLIPADHYNSNDCLEKDTETVTLNETLDLSSQTFTSESNVNVQDFLMRHSIDVRTGYATKESFENFPSSFSTPSHVNRKLNLSCSQNEAPECEKCCSYIRECTVFGRSLSPSEQKADELEKNIERLKSAISSASSSPYKEKKCVDAQTTLLEGVKCKLQSDRRKEKNENFMSNLSALSPLKKYALRTQFLNRFEAENELLKTVDLSHYDSFQNTEINRPHRTNPFLKGINDTELPFWNMSIEKLNLNAQEQEIESQDSPVSVSNSDPDKNAVEEPDGTEPASIKRSEAGIFIEEVLGFKLNSGSSRDCGSFEDSLVPTCSSERTTLQKLSSSDEIPQNDVLDCDEPMQSPPILNPPNRDDSFEEPSSVNHLQGHVKDKNSVSTTHRYFHLFRQRELEDLIEQYVDDLHVLQSYRQDSSWCITLEKVHVWTI